MAKKPSDTSPRRAVFQKPQQGCGVHMMFDQVSEGVQPLLTQRGEGDVRGGGEVVSADSF